MPLSRNLQIASLALAGMIGALVAVSAPPALAQQTDVPLLEGAPVTIVPGEVVVQLRPGTSEQSRDLVLGVVNGVFVRSLDQADLVLARVPAGTEMAAAESLEVDPNVVFAEPNGRLQASAQ